MRRTCRPRWSKHTGLRTRKIETHAASERVLRLRNARICTVAGKLLAGIEHTEAVALGRATTSPPRTPALMAAEVRATVGICRANPRHAVVLVTVVRGFAIGGGQTAHDADLVGARRL